MKRIIVGSMNPVKVAAVREAFELVFPDTPFEYVSHPAPSLVSNQPLGHEETKTGATNRAAACKAAYPQADYFVGLEGGLELRNGEHWVIAWMCILDTANTNGYGSAGSFLLPPAVSALILAGNELGAATDAMFNEMNSKQKSSTVGILTNDLITRKEYYRDPIIFALIPFLKPELYRTENK